MDNNVIFRGIMPALVSPVNEDGSLKKEATVKLVKWLMSNGIHGLYICGSTGEGLVLRKETRMELLETVLDTVEGKIPVISHIGAIDLATTLELTRHASRAGAAAVSSIPPIYFKYEDDDIVNYYKAICDNSTVPMLMYGIGNAGTKLSFSVVERVLNCSPLAVGLKWTYPDFFTMGRIKCINNGNVNVINGPDEMLICGLAMGADAGIGTTYNLMPKLFVDLYNNFRAGKIDEARFIQHKINVVINALINHNVIPATKAVLNRMGFEVGNCVKPLKALSEQETDIMLKEMNNVIDFNNQIIN